MPTNWFRLQRHRLAKELGRRVPLHEVAAVLNVSDRQAGYYEVGHTAPPIGKAAELAKFLQVDGAAVVHAIAMQARTIEQRRRKAKTGHKATRTPRKTRGK